MADQTVLNLFKRRSMLAALEQLKPANNFFRSTFYPRVEEFDTAEVDIDVYDGQRKLAPHTTVKGGPIKFEKEGFKTFTYKPSHIFLEDETEAEDDFNRLIGNPLYSGETALQKAADTAARDLARMENAIVRTEELMAIQAATTGVVQLRDENGQLIGSIDFERDAGYKGELVATPWDQASSDPLADIRARNRFMKRRAGLNITDVILGSEAVDIFLQNEQVQAQLDNRRFLGLGEVEMQARDMGLTLVGTLEGGKSVWEYEEYYIDPETDEELPMIDPKGMICASRNADSRMLYGAVKDEQGRLTMGSRFAYSYVSEKDRNRFIQLESRPLPNPVQVHGFLYNLVLPQTSS